MIQKYFVFSVLTVSLCGCGSSLYNNASTGYKDLRHLNRPRTIAVPVGSAMFKKSVDPGRLVEEGPEIFKQINLSENFVPGTKNIFEAAERNNVNDIYYFYQLGIDINTTKAVWFMTGITPLYEAAGKNNVEAAEFLLELGAHVDLKNSIGYTALCTAADNNHAEVVEVLINAEADIDFPCGKSERTPLMFAARKGDFETAKVLVEAGANLELRSANGKTAIQYTSLIMNGGVRRLIKDHKKERELLEAQRAGI